MSASSASTTVSLGLTLRSMDAVAMPRVLPSPAVPITTPRSSAGSQSPIGCSRSRNAMNIVRKPVSQRGPQLARSANATAPGIRIRLPARAVLGVAAQHQRALAAAGVDLGREPDRTDRGDDEEHERVAQRPLGAGDRRQPGDRRGHGGTHDAGEGHPGVGLDQGESLRQQAGYGGGAGHAVRLGRDQHPERGREQPRRVGDHGGAEHPAEERADRHGAADRPAATVAEPVEERADQRRDDRERQHRQAEEQRHLAPRLAGRDLEEEGAGQGDRDRGIARGVERVHLDQPGEPGLAGALGPRGAAGLTAHELARTAGGAGHRSHAAPDGPRAAGVRRATPGGPRRRLLRGRLRTGLAHVTILPVRPSATRTGHGSGPGLTRP